MWQSGYDCDSLQDSPDGFKVGILISQLGVWSALQTGGHKSDIQKTRHMEKKPDLRFSTQDMLGIEGK